MIACNNKKDESSETPQVTQEEISDVEQGSAFAIHISINPEFVICVGADAKVQKVECGNQDAQAVLDQVDVTGKDCEEATYLIIKETVNQAFLKADGKIEVMVSLTPETAGQMDDWTDKVHQSIIRVLEEENMGAQFVIDAEVVEPGEEGNSAESESTEANLPETTNGETGADGNTIVREENGNVLVVNKDGKVLQITEPNGVINYMSYDANGNLVSEERIQQDQTYLYTYRSDGTVEAEIEQQADGMYKDDYFDSNGKPAQANFRNAEGGVEERTYRSDGTSYGYYYDPNGAVFYYEFDASGKQLLDTHKQIK